MKKRTLLIVEDEVKINNMICDFFNFNGYKTISAFDGMEGIKSFNESDEIDLIILDVMLPGIDGFTILNRIRKKSNVPVIMVTARGDKDDVLMGYEFKVDDYITKPFNLEILLAKVNVILDRIEILSKDTSNNETILQEVIEINGIKIDKLKLKVYVDNKEIQIERKQFEILQYLMENKNIVISRERLLENLWGYDYYGNTRVVDAQIKKLRKSLNHKSYLIKTAFGVGYKFDAE
ncbi:response regulator transcription factor [Clostridium perfringens]|nr:response regulator transcription factor [Clostridium perfringens]